MMKYSDLQEIKNRIGDLRADLLFDFEPADDFDGNVSANFLLALNALEKASLHIQITINEMKED